MEQNSASPLARVSLLVLICQPALAAEQWQGLVVKPEHRCETYNSREYAYPQSVEPRIVAAQGNRIYSPYSGRWFGSIRETDIEHIVARSEAHDSGLCAESAARKRQFSADILNLTLASPQLNRREKGARDAAQWLPPQNRCWFAARVIRVKQKYALSVDPAERRALAAVLAQCQDTRMVYTQPRPRSASGQAPSITRSIAPSLSRTSALARWDDNGNGRISCAEARSHGIAPVRRTHPAYPYMRDGNNDGIICN